MRTHDVQHLRVGDQYVRGGQRLHGTQRQQTRVSRPGTQEGDLTGGGVVWGGGVQSARSPIRPAAPFASISAASSRPMFCGVETSSGEAGTCPVVDICTSVLPSVEPTTPRRCNSVTACSSALGPPLSER